MNRFFVIALVFTLGLCPASAQFVQSPPFGAGQIPGTVTNDSACTTCVGAYLTAALATGSAVDLVSTVTNNVTSITLTAGDWDIWAVGRLKLGGTTTVTYAIFSIEATNSALVAAVDTTSQMGFPTSVIGAAGVDPSFQTPVMRKSVAASTDFFLNANAQFGTSTAKAYGSIFARRRR